MEFAKLKYNELLEDTAWISKDKTEQQFIALTSQLHQTEAKAARTKAR